MSWTSESEPPRPRPDREPEDFAGDGFEVIGLDDEQSIQNKQPDAGSVLDDDGPLDPSVFDGLFDDLDGSPDPEPAEDHFVGDEPRGPANGYPEQPAIDDLFDSAPEIGAEGADLLLDPDLGSGGHSGDWSPDGGVVPTDPAADTSQAPNGAETLYEALAPPAGHTSYADHDPYPAETHGEAEAPHADEVARYTADQSEQHTAESQRYTRESQQYTAESERYTRESQQYTAESEQYTRESQQHTAESEQYTAEQVHQYTAERAQQYAADQAKRYTADQSQRFTADQAQQFTADQYTAESELYTAESDHYTPESELYTAESDQYTADPAYHGDDSAEHHPTEPAPRYTADHAEHADFDPDQHNDDGRRDSPAMAPGAFAAAAETFEPSVDEYDDHHADQPHHGDSGTDDGGGPADGVVATSITLDPEETPFETDGVQLLEADPRQVPSNSTVHIDGGAGSPIDGRIDRGRAGNRSMSPDVANQPPGLYQPGHHDGGRARGHSSHTGYAEADQNQYGGYSEAEVQQHPQTGAGYPSVPYQTPRSRRWPAFAVATFIGAFLGIGGAVLLFQLIRFSGQEDQPETADTAPAAPVATTVDQATSTDESVVAAPVGTTPTSLVNLAATGRFELNTINFEPGTDELTGPSRVLLDEMVDVVIGQPNQPVSVAVRTFSEPSPQANRELSNRQAEAIVEYFVTKGAPIDSLAVHGMGAARLDLTQPVQNFVVVNTDLGQTGLQGLLNGMSPFAIGLDPITNQLRPESIEPLNTLGEALQADGNVSVSLAAYSFGEADELRNRELATVAAEATAAFLATHYEVNRSRVAVLAPGQELFATGSEIGNHVSLQWGAPAATAIRLSALTDTVIVFEPGSAVLTEGTVAVLDELIRVVTDADLGIAVHVHTATEATPEANLALSQRQADAIAQYLSANGLSEQRVRTYGGGNVRQFAGDGRTNRIVVTPIP